MILNLVVNARDAMPTGGRLEIACRNTSVRHPIEMAPAVIASGAYVVLEVNDTGCGMDADTKAQIFEPFFTTKEPGRGTGLGLATVYGIVQQSGGAIEVQSESGRGTTFRIYLPRVYAAVPAMIGGGDAPQAVSAKETVLLVEDEAAVRHMLRNLLRSEGYTVLEAGHPDEAIAISESHPGRIHALLTDLVMPGMNGRTLSERLTVQRPDMKVVFMSGYAGDAVLSDRLGATPVEFLQKPFSPATLTQTLSEALATE